ncbi:MAG TPA: beta-eliminating lyase-related protein, partial [Solirubrobacteraceae bacterium]|nr:beta-eliminating lyase-related protein [Solirubrobacteraceae bacterium]
MTRRGFGSDNHAGVLPAVLEAIAAVNEGHVPSYGHDEVTERVEALLRREFGDDARAFLVFNGTGANVLALRTLCKPWEGVICAESAHLNVDEGGAPERMGGIKLLTVPTPDAKLTPDLVEPRLVRFGDEHAVQPRVVSITQSTELGTLYTPEEVAALAE